MSRPVHRQSRIHSYLRCGEFFRRTVIEQERIPPAVAMARGTAVHKAAAANYEQKRESREDLPVEEIVEVAAAAFDAEVADGATLTPDEEASPRVALGRGKDLSVRMAQVYAKQQAPLYQPVLVEKNVRVELPGEFDLAGTIDLVDVNDVVVDTKTAGKKKNPREADRSLQLSVYSVLAMAEIGRWPRELRLEVLVDGSYGVQRQMLATTRDEVDMHTLAANLNAVAMAIGKGVFLPATEAGYWCSAKWCPFWRTCPYVRQGRRIEAPSLETTLRASVAETTLRVSGEPLPKRRRRLSAKEITAVLKDQPRCRCGVLLTPKSAQQDTEHELRLVCRACAKERQIIPMTPEV